MKIFLNVIFIFIINISFSQTIKELERELRSLKSGEEWGNKKDKAYKLLDIDGLNNEAIDYLITSYKENNQHDSINVLFDGLIIKYPKSPKPYLIRAENNYARFGDLDFTQKIDDLKKAKELDHNNIEATYELGEIYYELFLYEYSKGKDKAIIVPYAKTAVQYFSDLRSFDLRFKEVAKYPLIQLYGYLRERKKVKELKKDHYQYAYFPICSFMELPKNWETNYTVNSVWNIKSAMLSMDWYSKHLKALDEPVLNDISNYKVYRFTYLRTFDNPIVIRIENKNGSVSIHWKVSDGAGGYDTGKIIEKESKELTIKEWELIENKIHSIDFWKQPTNETEIFGTDGSRWILEGKTLGKYNVVDKWCGGKIESVCKEMLELTDLKLEKDEIY